MQKEMLHSFQILINLLLSIIKYSHKLYSRIIKCHIVLDTHNTTEVNESEECNNVS